VHWSGSTRGGAHNTVGRATLPRDHSGDRYSRRVRAAPVAADLRSRSRACSPSITAKEASDLVVPSCVGFRIRRGSFRQIVTSACWQEGSQKLNWNDFSESAGVTPDVKPVLTHCRSATPVLVACGASVGASICPYLLEHDPRETTVGIATSRRACTAAIARRAFSAGDRPRIGACSAEGDWDQIPRLPPE